MHINIFGASGAGSTTLGKALGERLNYPCFDGDQLFWMPSAVPFTVKRAPEERNAMMNAATAQHPNWIVSGSVVGWKNNWDFNLSVFLYIPRDVRIARLEKREFERYGDLIYTDPERIKLRENFLAWAGGYDDNTTKGRTLQVHQDWIKGRTEPILIIDGDTTVEERIQTILNKLRGLE
jgi:adenylate kinase family enzyme